ncbi:MAG: hypothetical protein LAO23_19635 [Acidobacteriia bacterium]|nr:hypothetical protein [Terriglobia bacterium]
MIHLPAIAFLAYAGASLAWSPGDVPWAAALLLSLALAYGLGLWLRDLYWLWFGYCVVLAANVPIAIAFKAFGLSDLSGIQGLFGNPNYLACALAMGVAGALSYRLWWYLPFGVVGLLLCQSRGAMLAAGVVGMLALWSRFRATAMIVGLLSIYALLHFTETKSGYEASAVLQRLGIWQDTMNHFTIFGRGFGSFSTAYAAWPVHTNMTLILPQHAYNDAVELIFDLGIGAIPLWFAVAVALEGSGPRLPLVAFLILSLAFFPFFISPVGQFLALTLGHLTRRERTSYAPAIA